MPFDDSNDIFLSFCVFTEKKLGKLSTWILHSGYFLFGMLLLSFVQAPSYTRWIFLMLVPVNLTMDLQQGIALELPALICLMFLLSFGINILKHLNIYLFLMSITLTKIRLPTYFAVEGTMQYQKIAT